MYSISIVLDTIDTHSQANRHRIKIKWLYRLITTYLINIQSSEGVHLFKNLIYDKV